MATATGFLLPQSFTSDVLSGTSWSNAIACTADDDTEVIEAVTAKNTPGTGSLTTGWFKVGQYGFDSLIPANAIILKVEIQIRSRMNSTSGVGNRETAWALSGTRGTNVHTSTTEPTVLETITYDVTSERAWTQADLLDAVFQVHWRGRNGNSTNDPSYRLAGVKVQVTWDLPPDPPQWEDSIDDFNRADDLVEAGAGSTIWQPNGFDQYVQDARVISNQLGLSAVQTTRLYTKAIFAADFDLIWDIPAIGSSFSFNIAFAIQGAGTATFDCYAVEFTMGIGIAPYFRKYVDGVMSTPAVIYSAPCGVVAGDSVWVARRGTRVTAYRKPSGGQWTKYLEAEAPDYISGPVGLSWSNTSVRYDNFRGGPLGPSILASDSVTLSDSVSWVQTFDIPLVASDTVTLSDDLVLADFTPTAIANCVGWFDASQLGIADGAAVSAWPNLAPGGFALTLQGAAPVARGPEFGINGRPIVRFAGTTSGFYSPSSGVGSEFTVVYVGRMYGTTKGRVLGAYYAGGVNNFLIGWHGGDWDVAYMEGWLDGFSGPNPTGTTPKLYSADGTGAFAGRLFANGTQIRGPSGGTRGFNNTFGLSGAIFNLQGSDVDIAEIAIYNRKLTDPERQQVEEFLRAKWLTAGAALTITPADSVTTSDSPSFVQDQTLVSADAVTLSDIPTLAQDSVLNPTDSVTTNDSSIFVADLGLFITEDVVLTDNAVWAQTFALLLDVSDSITVTDFANLLFDFVSSFSDAVVLTDMMEIQVGLYFMSVVVLSDEVTWEQTTPQVVVTVI